MIKTLGQTFIGFTLSFSGFYAAYFYVTNIDGSTPLLLVPSVGLVAGGVVFLLRAAKSEGGSKKVEKTQLTAAEQVMGGKSESILERNNEMVHQWEKTTDARDKLKVLEVAAAAEEGK